jgi:predicted TIM-barrel fold metal-dependent hydrolase
VDGDRASERRVSPPPDRNPRSPKLKLPAGACDAHVHVYGPQARFPLTPGRKLDVEDCTLDDLFALQAAVGLSRAILVQSFQHGNSYEYMLHALGRAPDRLRGVASPASDITDGEISLLTKAGVVGARYAYPADPKLDTRMIHRLQDFGWQTHYFVHGPEQLATWRDAIRATPGKFVLEHMLWPPVAKGIDSAEFRFVLECLDTGRCWVKLSARFSAAKTLPFADTLPFIHALVARTPERLLWGSDWPHPNYFDPMPNDGDLVDLIADWIPDAAKRKTILTDNPAALFGFKPV